VLYRVLVRNLQSEFDADLYNHAVDVAQGINVDFFGALSVNADTLSAGKIFPFALGNAYVQVVSPDGTILARSKGLGKAELPRFPEDYKLLLDQGAVFRTVSAREMPAAPGAKVAKRGSNYRMLTYVVQKAPGLTLILQIAVPLQLLEQESKGLITFFLFAIPLTLIVAAFGGLFLSRRALLPVATIIDKARSLSPHQLGERIPVPDADDEIRQLALTLNGLLERLQKAFESQDRFVADASHQLKTPLAIIRGELDVLRSRGPGQEPSREEIGEFLESAAQELQFLSRMVEDLLLLARVDAGAGSLAIGRVRADEVTVEAASRLEKFARSRSVRLRIELDPNAAVEDFEIQGDSFLLQSMLQSLIENAIKFSPEGGVVGVRAGVEGGDLVRGRGSRRKRSPGFSSGFSRETREAAAWAWGSRSRSGSPRPTMAGSRSRASRAGAASSGSGLKEF
jgi:signal transduction histidine kinase